MTMTSDEIGVIVAVDGSPASHAAIRWAARAAATRKVPLTAFHALVTPAGAWPSGPYRDTLRERLEAEGRNTVVRATRAAEDAMVPHGRVPIARLLVHSKPAAALIEMSAKAEMIVVGSGRGSPAQGALGSVSSAVAHYANCPVAIIPEADLPDPKHAPVLVGVDGSPISDRATAIAFDEASYRGVELVALQALSDLSDHAERELPESDWAELEAEAERLLTDSLAGWQERYPGVPVTRVVVRDRPARQLIARSESAQLVVVGSGMLVGSVSNAILRGARIPVVIARPSSSMLVDFISSHGQPGVDDSLAAAKAKSALLQRLEGLPEDEQHAVLLDLVRANIVAVLKRIDPDAIDPGQAVQELVGFDSLAAVEMGNLLKSATGLALQPTVMFDYPKPAELAGHIHRELLGVPGEAAPAALPGDAEIQRVVGSIPVKRLRQAGVLELLLTLANESEANGKSGQPTEKSIAEMDLDDLVNTVLSNDDE